LSLLGFSIFFLPFIFLAQEAKRELLTPQAPLANPKPTYKF